MGLDMYLEAEMYVGGQYDHRNVKGQARIETNNEHYVINASDISSIQLNVGSWRKANAIHAWFVEHCQGGIDECQRSYVSREDLIALKALVMTVLENKDIATDVLPPQEGFFFGSYEVDEYYFQDMEETIVIIDKALAMPDNYEFYYQSSW